MPAGAEVEVPLGVRLRLSRACVQSLADDLGVDLLHIKGHAVSPTIRLVGRGGTDVDVMIRPANVSAFDHALRRNGWVLYSSFVHGSPFGHAQTYLHPEWGYLDLHRFFPGIDLEPSRAFTRLWADRAEIEIGGSRCPVPGRAAHALILILNSARRRAGEGVDAIDASAWVELEPEIRRLAAELDAGVAFAAATGTLEQWRGDRRYLLWKSVTEGGSRSAEWWARVRAAPTTREALIVAARAPLVNLDRLAHRLGRRPTKREILREFISRPMRGVRELLRSVSATRSSRASGQR
jgi:hypothetical protein